MVIGIIGAGHIGGTLARLLARAGHQVVVSNSRGPASLKELVDELGPNARAGTVADAARSSDILVLAVHWRTPEALPAPVLVSGKIVVDAMNPYREDGSQFDLGESSSSEETQKRLPGARIVKAFNTIWFKHLAENGRTDLPVAERDAIFVAGDDEEAKKIVSSLVEQIGFAPIDTGTLQVGGRRQQAGSPIYGKPMTGAEGRAMVASL